MAVTVYLRHFSSIMRYARKMGWNFLLVVLSCQGSFRIYPVYPSSVRASAAIYHDSCRTVKRALSRRFGFLVNGVTMIYPPARMKSFSIEKQSRASKPSNYFSRADRRRFNCDGSKQATTLINNLFDLISLLLFLRRFSTSRLWCSRVENREENCPSFREPETSEQTW